MVEPVLTMRPAEDGKDQREMSWLHWNSDLNDPEACVTFEFLLCIISHASYKNYLELLLQNILYNEIEFSRPWMISHLQKLQASWRLTRIYTARAASSCSSTTLWAQVAACVPSLFTVSSSHAQEAKQKIRPANQLPAVLQTQFAFLVCTRAAAPNTRLVLRKDEDTDMSSLLP